MRQCPLSLASWFSKRYRSLLRSAVACSRSRWSSLRVTRPKPLRRSVARNMPSLSMRSRKSVDRRVHSGHPISFQRIPAPGVCSTSIFPRGVHQKSVKYFGSRPVYTSEGRVFMECHPAGILATLRHDDCHHLASFGVSEDDLVAYLQVGSREYPMSSRSSAYSRDDRFPSSRAHSSPAFSRHSPKWHSDTSRCALGR